MTITIDTDTIGDFMDAMHNEGYAVVIWLPEELGNAGTEVIEEKMIACGWDYIREENPGTD